MKSEATANMWIMCLGKVINLKIYLAWLSNLVDAQLTLQDTYNVTRCINLMSDYSLRSYKNDIRKKIRNEMRNLPDSQRSDEEEKVTSHAINFLRGKPKGTLLAYAAFPPELNIDPVIAHALSNQWRVALPRISDITNGMMEIHQIESLDDLISGPMDIREPSPDTTIIDPASIDIGFIPAWAYDRNIGSRLGKGGGFYDRLLANPQWRAETYGIAYRCQLYDDLPVEPHDKHVEGIFHPDGLLRPH